MHESTHTGTTQQHATTTKKFPHQCFAVKVQRLASNGRERANDARQKVLRTQYEADTPFIRCPH